MMKNIRIASLVFVVMAFCTSGMAQKQYVNLHTKGQAVSYALENVDSLTFTENAIALPGEIPAARITKTIRYEEKKATVYNIEYPSADPYGLPVTQSGAIVIGDEILTDKHAKGMVLYNHFTVYHRDQCATRGDVIIPLKIVGSKLLGISPDYYGFGVTGDKNQAYCMPTANAQASVDCLIAARTLLKEMGFSWDDILLNLGYSEGGQTSVAVVRYCLQHHPEIKISHTLAGGGPYDMGETYAKLIEAKITAMPSTVISSMLAYNQYYNLGYKMEDMFLEPTLSKIDEYLLSKNYKQLDIEKNVATETIAEWMHPNGTDFTSDISKRMMEALKFDALTKNWTPAGNERITLVHNKQDAAVPFNNSVVFTEFMKEKGLKVTTSRNESFADGVIFNSYCDVPALNLGSHVIGAHELGALYFLTEFKEIISHYIGTEFDIQLTMEDLANF